MNILPAREMRRLRKARGLTNQAIADATGLNPYYISHILTGRKPGGKQAREAISEYLQRLHCARCGSPDWRWLQFRRGQPHCLCSGCRRGDASF